MPNTATENIWYPDDTAPVAPLEGLFSAMAASVDLAIAGVNTNGWPAVANQAARDALFPSPAEPNRVWRKDLNYAEVYYDTTGAITAGWYPAPGTDLILFVSRATTDSWSATTRTNINGVSGTLPAGRYTAVAITYLSGPISAGNTYLALNGTDLATPPCDLAAAGIRDGHVLQAVFNHAGGTATFTVDQLFVGTGSKTVYAGSTILVRYQGPRR